MDKGAPVNLLNGDEIKHKIPEEIKYNFDADIEEEPPKDRMKIVYIIMLLHGIGVLIPWNVFINANSYFVDYKLSPNVTGTNEYKNNFLSYLGIASQLPNVILNAINLFIQVSSNKAATSKGYQTHPRIPISIIINVLMCIITVALAIVNTFSWPKIFFILTMITVIIMNSATGVYQNSIFGLVGSLPMSYTNAIVIGNNICGTLVALINILVIIVAPNPRLSAIWYFIAAQFVLLVCFDSYFALPLLRFYRHHARIPRGQIGDDLEQLTGANKKRKYSSADYLAVFKKTWVQCFGVFYTFFVTLTIFPAIQAQIERYNPNFFISDKYYLAIIVFLNFNFFALVGNCVSEFVKTPGPKWIWLPIVLRTAFIPLFLFCNYRPGLRHLPVLIKNDYVYALLGILLAFTNGYYSSLTMMYAPRLVSPHRAPLAGMMAALFLVLGVFFGVNFSLLISKIFR